MTIAAITNIGVWNQPVNGCQSKIHPNRPPINPNIAPNTAAKIPTTAPNIPAITPKSPPATPIHIGKVNTIRSTISTVDVELLEDCMGNPVVS